jgi:hypothetical protein
MNDSTESPRSTSGPPSSWLVLTSAAGSGGTTIGVQDTARQSSAEQQKTIDELTDQLNKARLELTNATYKADVR